MVSLKAIAIHMLSSVAIAMPVNPSADPASGVSVPNLLQYANAFADAAGGQCDLSQARLPIAPTPLPAPSVGMTLSHIAVGRGTQNFTCTSGNTTSAPVPIGAFTALFNITCLIVDVPELAAYVPQIALDLPLPFSPAEVHDSQFFYGYSGIHYFLDHTTPFFNLDTDSHQYGFGAFKKIASSLAPAGSIVGPYNQGNGATTWLKLSADTGYSNGSQPLKEVYRVQTAGGDPPKTCLGQESHFQVPYAAQYWFYT